MMRTKPVLNVSRSENELNSKGAPGMGMRGMLRLMFSKFEASQ